VRFVIREKQKSRPQGIIKNYASRTGYLFRGTTLVACVMFFNEFNLL